MARTLKYRPPQRSYQLDSGYAEYTLADQHYAFALPAPLAHGPDTRCGRAPYRAYGIMISWSARAGSQVPVGNAENTQGMISAVAWKSMRLSSGKSVMIWKVLCNTPGPLAWSLTVRTWTALLAGTLSSTST